MENAQPLNTVGGEDLLLMHLPPQQFVVEELLPVGLAMIVGATKTGKSFLTLQLCLAVSQGESFWDTRLKKVMSCTLRLRTLGQDFRTE